MHFVGLNAQERRYESVGRRAAGIGMTQRVSLKPAVIFSRLSGLFLISVVDSLTRWPIQIHLGYFWRRASVRWLTPGVCTLLLFTVSRTPVPTVFVCKYC